MALLSLHTHIQLLRQLKKTVSSYNNSSVYEIAFAVALLHIALSKLVLFHQPMQSDLRVTNGVLQLVWVIQYSL